MKLTLYYAPNACSIVPLILLHEAGAEVEVKTLNFAAGEHRQPQYLAVNPKHKVPTLLIDDVVLTENVAIQTWIARQFPAARLLPDEPMANVQALSVLAWCASGFHPNLTPQFRPEWFCDTPGSSDSVRRMAREKLLENLAVADRMLAGREWFFDRFGAPDAYFFWVMRRANQLGTDTAALPNCQAHFERTGLRPSVQQAVAFDTQALASLAPR